MHDIENQVSEHNAQKELDFLISHSRTTMLGLPRRTLIERLSQKYGDTFLSDMNKAWTNPFWTLSVMGQKYGVTREYIRQLFYRLYGFRYTKAMKKHKEILRDDFCVCANDPRHKAADYRHGSLVYKGAIAELKVFDKCKTLGYDVYANKTKEYDLLINGYPVDVKGSWTSRSCGGKSSYFHFGVSAKQLELCKFIIGWVAPKDVFYVLPLAKIFGPEHAGKKQQIFIRDNAHHFHTWKGAYPHEAWYEVYREAWDLLTPPTDRLAPHWAGLSEYRPYDRDLNP